MSASDSADFSRSRSDETHFRFLVESANDYAIFSTDLARIVSTWNPGAERVFGFSEAEIVGRTADVLFTPEDRAKGAPAQEASTAAKEGKALDERWHLRKGGERFFGSGMMFPVLNDQGEHIGFMKIARDLTERRLAAQQLVAATEALQRANDELEEKVRARTADLESAIRSLRAEIDRRSQAEAARLEVARRIVNAQEDERLRLSRELHDEIGQRVAALMLEVGSLGKNLTGTPGGEARPKIQALIEQIGTELHGVAVQLRPTALDDLGLKRALEACLALWSKRTGIVAARHFQGLNDRRSEPEIDLAVYRVVQESLTNIAKHAHASQVSVTVTRTDHLLIAVIEDNGRGFEAEKNPIGAGLGLLGLRERMALVGGDLIVDSQPGAGTRVHARIPLPKQP